MRRHLLLAAAAGTLVLGACSDQTPTEPTVPAPSETFGTSCSVTRFPLLAIANQIKAIYPAQPRAQALLRAEALLRAGAIKLAWDTCHPVLARRIAFAFIDWLNRHTPVGKEDQVEALILAILRGIGEVTAPESSGDFGIGFFDPASTDKTMVKTVNGRALVELDPQSFLVPTVIVISRTAGDPPLTNFDGRQFPPTYDYNAINSTNEHVLQPGKAAVVAFCLLFLDDAVFPGGYPAGRRIGHNPVLGAPGFPFEILDPVDLVAAGLRDDLNCPEGTLPDPGGLSSSGGGLQDLADAALRTAGSYLLPPPLWAAALAELPPPPPLGGKARSLSPFKVVEVIQNQIEPFGSTIGPEDGNTVGVPLNTCSNDGCPVRFRVTDGEVPVQTSSSLIVSLIQGEGSTGVLSGTTTRSTSTEDPYTAVFDDLTISEPGSYQLMVTSSGAASHTTGVFTVGPAVDDPLVLNVTTVEKLPGGTQHFVVQSGSPGPYIWSVNGVDGGNATYGTIVTNLDFTADYTAPSAVPSTPTFDVCARRQANPLNEACASVTITAPTAPSPGADIVVVNDLNVFDNTGMENAGNQMLVRNLVTYAHTGPRGTGTKVWVDGGRSSQCPTAVANQCNVTGLSSFISQIAGVAMTVTFVSSTPDFYTSTSIPSDVKVIFLWTPRDGFSPQEVNTFKQFAADGGRLVFVGENTLYYSAADIAMENQLMAALGAQLTNTGDQINCGAYFDLPTGSIRAHQITAGVTSLSVACASRMTLGPQDFALFYDTSNSFILSAVARINTVITPSVVSAHRSTVNPQSTKAASSSNPVVNAGVDAATGAAAPVRKR